MEYKYWVQFVFLVRQKDGTISQSLEVDGIARNGPLSEFQEVLEMGGYIANQMAIAKKLPPADVSVKILSWTALEKTMLYLPQGTNLKPKIQ